MNGNLCAKLMKLLRMIDVCVQIKALSGENTPWSTILNFNANSHNFCLSSISFVFLCFCAYCVSSALSATRDITQIKTKFHFSHIFQSRWHTPMFRFEKKTMNTNTTTKNEIEMSEPQANLNAKRVQTQITRKKNVIFYMGIE